MIVRSRRWLGVGLALASLMAGAGAHAESFDVILRGGTVIDGSGSARYVADVGVRRGHIAAVGDLSADAAPLEIPVRGLVVAPGFINIHGHPEAGAADTAVNMLTQGVTTEIGNADGSGMTDLAAQRRVMAARGLATNLGLYIGFNSAWADVMRTADRRPNDRQVEAMRARITAGLAAGAWGVSAGLDYKPAFYASRDDVVRVVSVARPWRTNFPNHERLSPGTGYSGMVGMTETVDIARASGLGPVITHMKSQGAEQGRGADVLALIDAETARGRFAAGDVYPYLYGFNNVRSLLIPAWALDGGAEAFRARLRDPAVRARLVVEIEEIIRLRFNGPTGVYIASQQRELTDLMAAWGVSAGEAVVRLNEQFGDAQPTTYLRFGAEQDLRLMLRHPTVAISCDCGSLAVVSGHPRAFGTFPRVLGHYVRDAGDLTLEEAIRKMTSLPAGIVGMVDRGLLAPGMAADIAVFDPAIIGERGDPDRPALAEGVRFVLVNGQVALRDGAPTGVKAGQSLWRRPDMPSRLPELAVARRVQGSALRPRAAGAAQRLTFDIATSGAGPSRGGVRLRNAEGRVVFASVRLGILQVHDRWASITGWGRAQDGEVRPFTLIVDGAGPEIAGGPHATLTVDGEDLVAAAALRSPRFWSAGLLGASRETMRNTR